MMDGQLELIVSALADLDLIAMLDWGEDRFVESAVTRYRTLVSQALRDPP